MVGCCWLVLRLAPRFEGARLGRVGAGIQFRGVGVGLGAAGSLPPVPGDLGVLGNSEGGKGVCLGHRFWVSEKLG